MRGILKFKPTIKNDHTINCIVRCKIWVCALSISLFVIWNSKQVSPWFCVCCSWNFLDVSSIMLEISLIMLALCFMLSSPYYAINYANIINSSLITIEKGVSMETHKPSKSTTVICQGGTVSYRVNCSSQLNFRCRTVVQPRVGQAGPRTYHLFAVPCYFDIKIPQSINSSQNS